jgi:hypothetical protein
MSSTIVYYIPETYRAREWAGTDIALVSILGVILLVVVTCAFADCTARPSLARTRRSGYTPDARGGEP